VTNPQPPQRLYGVDNAVEPLACRLTETPLGTFTEPHDLIDRRGWTNLLIGYRTRISGETRYRYWNLCVHSSCSPTLCRAASLSQQGAGAAIIPGDSVFQDRLDQIVALEARYVLPTSIGRE
jgi:hypothetical protein